MALEVDALVRSIEDEKIEEEERERVRFSPLLYSPTFPSSPFVSPTLVELELAADLCFSLQTRDVLARIDGINDKVRSTLPAFVLPLHFRFNTD